MKQFKEFVAKFTDQSIPDVHKFGRRLYQLSPELLDVTKLSSRNINREPEHAGLLLGEMKGKTFRAAFPLLDILGTLSDRKAVIDDKAEWLFVCGRDIFRKSVISCSVSSGLVLVTNKKDEVLGLGKIEDTGGIAINDVLDRGDFLRREMFRKK